MRTFFRWIIAALVALTCAFGVSWIWTMPNSHERGVWQHEADGHILTLSRTSAQLYHQTSHSCVPTLWFPAHMALVKAMEGAWVEVSGDRLDLHVDGSIGSQNFTRLDALPSACLAPPAPSPPATFDAMWTIMDEHYAFFDLHGVNWDDRRDLGTGLDAATNDEDLFAVLKTALDGLDDGHIQLIAGDLGFYSPSEETSWMPDTPLPRSALNDVARSTITIPLTAIPQTGLEYGLREDGIGYVLITQMSTDPGFGELGTEVAQSAFAQVSEALSKASAIIVDVRYNPGGDDGTALAYAGYFTEVSYLALTKQTRQGNGWTPAVEAHVTPAVPDLPLSMPVILLTSELTGSGAEIFTMAMRENPNVTVMGENTGGGLSDILGTTLPNGWRIGLSNQAYFTPDGMLYEGIGLPPDIVIDTDGTALANGQDPVLMRAIETASSLR